MCECNPDDAYEPEGSARQYGEDPCVAGHHDYADGVTCSRCGDVEDEGFDTFGLVFGMRVLRGLCLRCGSNDGVDRLCRRPHDPTMACLACADDYHAFWDEEDESARWSRL